VCSVSVRVLGFKLKFSDRQLRDECDISLELKLKLNSRLWSTS